MTSASSHLADDIFDSLKEKVEFNHDKDANVLYISFGKPKTCMSEEQFPGILVRTDIDTKQVSGITILDYEQKIK